MLVDRYLKGTHAIVTGGSRGIGRITAHELARLGAHLTIMGRDADTLSRIAFEIRAQHSDQAVRCAGDVIGAEPFHMRGRGAGQKQICRKGKEAGCRESGPFGLPNRPAGASVRYEHW